MSLLTQLAALNASAEEALTQFAYDPENPPWEQKKEKGLGGAVAGAAAIGAGGYGVHRGVMKNSNSDAGTGAFGRTPTRAGVVQSYKNAGQDIARNVSEAGQKIANRWNNPMGNKAVDPTTVDRLKSSATTAGRQGKQLLKKMVRTIFHYSDGSLLGDLTEMNAQAEEALTMFDGGYINTPKGVMKEKGAGAHIERNAGKYIGSAIFLPVGLPAGYLIDRSRRKHNMRLTATEEERPTILGKGPAMKIAMPQGD